jgi:hypothetical protein
MTGMVSNGYIQFVQEQGGGFDGNGNPIATTKSRTTPIPCNVNVLKKEYITVNEGQVRQARYSITINLSTYEKLELTDFSEVTIEGAGGLDYGTHQVQDTQILKYVDRLKIVL